MPSDKTVAYGAFVLVAGILGALGALGIVVFGLLLAQDSINHVSFALPHVCGLILSLFLATCGGFLDRTRSAWFGWLSYGALLPSAIIVLGLGVPSLRTGALPKADWAAFFVGLLIFAVSFPATLVARRRARSRLALVQSMNCWRSL
jgi:hypothetical protein